MIPILIILLILILCILSSLVIYIFLSSRFHSKCTEIQRIKYPLPPSFDLITKKLPYRRRSSKEFIIKPTNSRSTSLANHLFIQKCSNRRQSAIIDSKQIAQIQFELPLTADKYRRRSVAVCNNLIETKQSSIHSLIQTQKISNEYQPCLVSFSLTYLKSSQIQIRFHSISSLPTNLQQLTIKVRLYPEGKTKNLEIKRIYPNVDPFIDENIEDIIQFSNISTSKLHQKALLMKFSGKDQAKKTVLLGQVGKIHLNQLQNFPSQQTFEFIHEIETIKLSTIEILVLLEKHNDHTLTVDIKQLKGLKFNQKSLNETGFFQVILLDRHRPLATSQTKSHRLNSSTVSLNDPIHLNILAFHPNNFDLIMILIYFYKTLPEYRCLGRVKLSSILFTSGTGTIHWQQFKDRQTFSMWHTLIKQ